MLMLLEFPVVAVPTQTTLSHFFFDHGNIGCHTGARQLTDVVCLIYLR